MAVYYFRNIGGDSNTASNWSLTSGGPADGAVPTLADTAIWDANSGNCVLNANFAADFADFTGYTGTLSGASSFTFQSLIKFSAGMTITAAGLLISRNAGTIEFSGKTWPGTFTWDGAGNSLKTIVGDYTIAGLITFGINVDITGSGHLIAQGGITGAGAYNGSASTGIKATGGTISGNVRFNCYFESAGTVVVTDIFNLYSETYILSSGTIDFTAATLSFLGGATFTFPSGTTCFAVTGTAVGSCTITNPLTVTSSFSTSINKSFNGANITLNGNLTVTAGALQGSCVFVLPGTTIITTTGSASVRVSITIQPGANVTFSGNVNYGTNTLTNSGGTVNMAGSTLTIIVACTLNMPGVTFNNIIANASITINSAITASSISSSTGTVAFTGTAGFTANTLLLTAASARTITFNNLVTYTALNNITATGVSGGLLTLTSASATLRVPIILQTGGTQSVEHVSAIRIDSSGGETITNRTGLLTNTVNWKMASSGIISFF